MKTIVNGNCPRCGSEEVVDTKRLFVDHLTDTEVVANLKKCGGDHNYRFYPEGVYDQIWAVGSDWGQKEGGFLWFGLGISLGIWCKRQASSSL